MVNTLYESEPGDAIAVLTIHYYTDAGEALFMFEQDTGGTRTFINGLTVYISSNLEHYSYSWLSGSTVTFLTGVSDTEIALSIVEELIGGIAHE